MRNDATHNDHISAKSQGLLHLSGGMQVHETYEKAQGMALWSSSPVGSVMCLWYKTSKDH